jgi:hypothetical protein
MRRIVINNIKYRGDRYAVIPGGKPTASLVPVEPARSSVTMAELQEIMRVLPRLDSNDTAFESDVMAAVNAQSSIPVTQTRE